MENKVTARNPITEGCIWKGMLLFALPIMLGSLLQQLYNTADAVIVGRPLGKAALASVGGSSARISNLLVNAFVALSSGASVIVAQHFGALADIAMGETAQRRRKPAPDMVNDALAALGADKSRAVYVGDSEVDIETARNAGIPCISVTWGFRDREQLVEAGAAELAADAGELHALLEK